jgi:hypothetical protein
MGRAACTEPQCLYKVELYLYLTNDLRDISYEQHVKFVSFGFRDHHTIIGNDELTNIIKMNLSTKVMLFLLFIHLFCKSL